MSRTRHALYALAITGALFAASIPWAKWVAIGALLALIAGVGEAA